MCGVLEQNKTVHLLYSDKETHAKRSESLCLYEYVYTYHFFCNGLPSLTLDWMAWMA